MLPIALKAVNVGVGALPDGAPLLVLFPGSVGYIVAENAAERQPFRPGACTSLLRRADCGSAAAVNMMHFNHPWGPDVANQVTDGHRRSRGSAAKQTFELS